MIRTFMFLTKIKNHAVLQGIEEKNVGGYSRGLDLTSFLTIAIYDQKHLPGGIPMQNYLQIFHKHLPEAENNNKSQRCAGAQRRAIRV